jgi:lipopolysaccharide export system permease protein
MVEDGRDHLIYIKYSLMNFPKIISKIYPFALFFSFSYVLTKYELNNELIIFWNFGVSKIELINFFLRFSILLTIFQLLFTIYIVPETQNLSRSLIRTSNVDFFEGFIKPKKFNDNIKGLTIYAEEKNEIGELKNIYLKKSDNNNEFQITIAKKGIFKSINSSKILVLYDGQTINSINNNLTSFNFAKSDFMLSTLSTDVVISDKIQETKTINHINCIKKYYKKNLKININQKEYLNHNCSLNTLDSLFQELYKRFIVPLYIPILVLTSMLLITFSKENKSYHKNRILIFFTGLSLIIISETLLKFIKNDFYFNFKIIILPLIIFILIYIFCKLTLKKNLKKII